MIKQVLFTLIVSIYTKFNTNYWWIVILATTDVYLESCEIVNKQTSLLFKMCLQENMNVATGKQ